MNKRLQVKFVSSHDQLVDMLTKPLSLARFNINILDLPLRLQGYVKELVNEVADKKEHI